MPNLTLGSDYYFISDSDYLALQGMLSGSGYTMEDFGFTMHSTDAGYQGYFAEPTSIDDDENLFLMGLGLTSYGPMTIFESVQASYVG